MKINKIEKTRNEIMMKIIFRCFCISPMSSQGVGIQFNPVQCNLVQTC